jgi:3-deoxy-7-phosphoheptulonate synthase
LPVSIFNIKTETVNKVTDINVSNTTVLPSPRELREQIVKTDAARDFVAATRRQMHEIIFGDDDRLLMVVGPCSIHDVEMGKEYARRLAELAKKVSDRMLLVMRVYFEKPRTTVGWKGLIMDPELDGTCNIPGGLPIARQLLADIIGLGVPTATELLDPITPQYIADLISWSAIGARTTESQTHRQMASGLSMPLGFKNGTDGGIEVAINAIKAACQPQTFLGVNLDGRAAAITTRGNPNCHIVLRGGSNGPNFSAKDIAATCSELEKNNLIPAVMIDCSHANSGKDPERQPEVLTQVIEQAKTNRNIIGAMIESNLHGGSQAFPQPIEKLRFGVSITDGCLGWEQTESAILEAHSALAARFQ